MRIALDGSDLAAERVEGPSVYAGELLPRLARVLCELGHAVTTYVPGRLHGVTVSGEVRVIPGRRFWTQRVLAAALRRDSPDVLFLPIQMLPIFRPRAMATVAVIHDLEFLRYPETYTIQNRLLLRYFTRQAAREATRLIAVSQYTKDEVVRVYGRSARDITVVHHGVNRKSFSRHEVDGEQRAEEHRRRYHLPERYLLCVGSLQPRKNLEGLVGAFERLPEALRDLHLVLVSGGGWKEQRILARIKTSPVHDRIKLFRHVPAEDMPGFYQAARAVAVPSLSEGFGLPVLEAMAAGTPVVVSRTSALPEVADDAALFINPRDTAGMAQAVARVVQDEALRQLLVTKGRQRAAQFTWERATEATARVIEEADRRGKALAS